MSEPTATKDWREPASFNAVYSTRPGPVYLGICREAYGDDYPEDVQPHSFLTRTDLARIVPGLALGPGSVLVDLGCGRGGTGLWLARDTGADLIGIDLAANGIALATARAAELGLTGRARFLVGELCATGLPDQSCDGAVSIDVLMFVEDKAAAIREIRRVLRSGGRFAATVFEPRAQQRYGPLLREHGFDLEVCEEKPDWWPRQRTLYQRTIEQQAALSAEMGESARTLVHEAEYFLAHEPVNMRHAIIVARRT